MILPPPAITSFPKCVLHVKASETGVGEWEAWRIPWIELELICHNDPTEVKGICGTELTFAWLGRRPKVGNAVAFAIRFQD
jgi:hypothetical protein